MSSQSGIVAEQPLLGFLHTSLQSPQGLEIVTARISDDSTCVQLGTKYDSLPQLESELGSEPIYVLIKDPRQDVNQYIFGSYIPDSSPVRLKMLYASTKNTLVRQIGSYAISKQLLFTDPSDVKNALDSSDAVSQEGQKSLLTPSEITDIEISQEQQRMKIGSQKLVSQTNGAPTSLMFDVKAGDSTIGELLQSFNVVYCKIDLNSEQINVVKKATVDEPSQLDVISDSPSYTLYRNGSLNYFIYSCPSGSKVKDRMVYASNRLGFINHLKNNDKLEFTRIIEIGDPQDLELSLISTSSEEEQKQEKAQEAAAHTVSSGRKFTKPKGPGRRR